MVAHPVEILMDVDEFTVNVFPQESQVRLGRDFGEHHFGHHRGVGFGLFAWDARIVLAPREDEDIDNFHGLPPSQSGTPRWRP